VFVFGIDHLDAAVAAVADVDVALGVVRDRVRRVQLADLGAARLADGRDPVAVLRELGDARVDVAVADVDVALGVQATSVGWRNWPFTGGSGGVTRFQGSASSDASFFGRTPW
jgi:hypothetical protein